MIIDLFSENPNALNAWKDMENMSFYNGSKKGHDIRLNPDFLEKYSKLTLDQQTKMRTFMQNQKSPSGRKGQVDYHETRHVEGLGDVKIYYDKNGFPEFQDYSPKPTSKFRLESENLKGTSADFKLANEKLASKYGFEKPYPKGPDGKYLPLEVDGYKWTPNSNNFELNGIKYTWHHHQDGKNIFPVQSRIHNTNEPSSPGFPHSGGDKLINDGLKGFFEAPKF